jgi:hypothetical protein
VCKSHYIECLIKELGIVCVCKAHYVDGLLQELGIDNSLDNPTYTPDDTCERGNPGQSQVCFMFLWNFNKDEELDLPSLYWIPKLHNCPFKQCYIVGSAKCSTKPLPKLLTSTGILLAVKTGLQSYCDTSYSRSGVNQM